MRDEELFLPDGDVRPSAPAEAEGKRAAPEHGYRILYPLLALLVFVALVPLASLAWKLLAVNRETLALSQQEFQLLLASSIAGQLDSHIDGLQGRIEALASSFGALVQAQGLRSVEKDLVSKPILGNLLDDKLISLRFVTEEGHSYQARSAGLEIEPEVEQLVRRVVASARKEGERGGTVSTPCLIGRRGAAAVVISSPVIASGGPRAVLVGLVDISRLWERIVDQARAGQTVYAMDQTGRLFAHTDTSLVARRADLRDTEIVQRFLGGAGRSKETMLFSMPKPGGGRRSFLGSYESTSRGWGIFVQVEEQYAYALIREMVKDTLSWSAGTLVVAVVLAFAFAGKLSQPVRKLTDAARRFAEGDFTARAHVLGRDEIGELAQTFNRMAEDIESHIRRIQEAARDNNELFLGAIRALAEAIDAKDPYTRGHSVRVNRFAVVIAQQMGLDSRQIRDIHVASLLHDVGKIGIDDAILKKPANLTPEEFTVMKQHPDKGAKIMGRVERLKTVIPGMRHHHERYDGGGYPLGLKGEEIPLAARIITVADILDAMTSNRPYSRAMTFEAAMARLNEIKGTITDPQVVEAFNRAYLAGEFATEEQKLAQQHITATSNTAEVPAAVPS